jgi:hypothetical protein
MPSVDHSKFRWYLNTVAILLREFIMIFNVSQYDCFNAPHKLENTMYSWWNDRNGNSQYFWAGNNAYGIPTCQCGIDGNCAVSSVMCNCDSLAQQQLSDKGKLCYSCHQKILKIMSQKHFDSFRCYH